MKENKKTRKLKVYSQSGYKYRNTPTIVLKGKWLEDSGFEIGKNFWVELGDGIITLKMQ